MRWSLTEEIFPAIAVVTLAIIVLLILINRKKHPRSKAIYESVKTVLQYGVILSICLMVGEVALRIAGYDPTQREDLYSKDGRYHFTERDEEKGVPLHRDIVKEAVDGIDFWTIKESEVDTLSPESLGGNLVAQTNPSPDAIKILGIGDSVTYGSGVKNHQTFLHRLQELARQDGIDVHTMNVATPGWNLAQYEAAVSRYVKATKPNIVLIGINHSDVVPIKLVGNKTVRVDALVADGLVMADGLPIEREQAKWLGKHFYLARALAYWLSRGQMKPKYREADDDVLTQAHLDRIYDIVKGEGAKLALVWLPPLDRPFSKQLSSPHFPERIFSLVSQWANDHSGVLLIDPRYSLLKLEPAAIGIDTCCHFNPQGHDYMAQILLTYFEDKGWLK